MAGPGRNDRCPCGSGKKFKACCLRVAVVAPFTREDRNLALSQLVEFAGTELAAEDGAALDEYWGEELLDASAELPPHFNDLSEHACDLWFCFDRPLPDGMLPCDAFLKRFRRQLPDGQRRYLETLRPTSVRLYEIEDLRPGDSLTLRDLLEGDRITVQERGGSRTLIRFDWIATRVVPVGASGRPEMEGVFHVAGFGREEMRDELRAGRDAFRRSAPQEPITAFYKRSLPLIHQAWVRSILFPRLPKMVGPDGEELVPTESRFEVLDAAAVVRALDGQPGVSRQRLDEPEWSWQDDPARTPSSPGPFGDKAGSRSLGTVRLKGTTLTSEAFSISRAERLRGNLERACGAAIRHLATVHENLEAKVREGLVRQAFESDEPRERPLSESPEIPFEVQEALVLDFQGQHMRRWPDEPVPALDGMTPRAAAGKPEMRERLAQLLKDGDAMYQRALAAGQPAYDPSWLWEDLGLRSRDRSHPPPLAPERLDQLVPGSGERCRSIAESLRTRTDFSDARSVFTAAEARTHLELQRFLREHDADVSNLSEHLRWMVNYHLHRRKAFWVDEALAYMLHHTVVDLLGREVQVPFPAFVMVFTDRHVLSLGERYLSRVSGCPVKGRYLQVLTVYAAATEGPAGRALELTFAFDALGADAPWLVEHRVPLRDEAPVELPPERSLDLQSAGEPVAAVDPFRGLVTVALNAIQYATSAGVEPQRREPPAPPRSEPRSGCGSSYSSDAVYFLPGAIDISQVRRLQEIERTSSGRSIVRRFLVRGHWRRAAANWSNPRPRWIQPHWKGPDMATVIERTYRLQP